MSIRWRCAICEAVNDGGETCAACGATVTQTVVQPMPAEAPSTPERAPGDDDATEIPVRKLPRRRPETDAAYDTYEPIGTRPRVRVYGCCLPIALGGLLAFLATAALLLNLVIGVL
jgi:hypothetical protein